MLFEANLWGPVLWLNEKTLEKPQMLLSEMHWTVIRACQSCVMTLNDQFLVSKFKLTVLIPEPDILNKGEQH